MLKNTLLNILYPKLCIVCKKPSSYLCPNCQKYLKLIKIQKCPYCQKPSPSGYTHPQCLNKTPLSGSYSIFYYQGPTKSLIKKAKYSSSFDLLPYLVSLSKPYLPSFFYHFDLLIPIPLHKDRKKLRGFNQSQIIASSFSKITSIPTKPILLKNRATLPQAQLKTKSQRINNLKNVFSLNPKSNYDIKNKKLLLIDDITTTSTTLTQAAKSLKQKNPQSIWALTLARG